MKKCYLDANFLIFLQDVNSPFYPQALMIFKKLIEEGFHLFISPLVLDEFLMGSLKLSGKSAKEMRENLKLGLKTVFKFPNLTLINPPLRPEKHLKITTLMAKFSLKPRDAYHLFIMQENRVKYFLTFDSDFEQVFFRGNLKRIIT